MFWLLGLGLNEILRYRHKKKRANARSLSLLKLSSYAALERRFFMTGFLVPSTTSFEMVTDSMSS